ncbi:hypothetical protein OPV22_013102 [Ensete ventricosum]|uniref:Uncharacterized protein n=1 Tax=Ensete ventricosum TaxID=4639 RepID=A0AAV8R458_ENSVE|nr:hypothetical protein OPV22_013102 [Ensete ventricosum]
MEASQSAHSLKHRVNEAEESDNCNAMLASACLLLFQRMCAISMLHSHRPVCQSSSSQLEVCNVVHHKDGIMRFLHHSLKFVKWSITRRESCNNGTYL